jgi:hypothetical protein
MTGSNVADASSSPLHVFRCIGLRLMCRVPLGCTHHAEDERLGCIFDWKFKVFEATLYAELEGNLPQVFAGHPQSANL